MTLVQLRYLVAIVDAGFNVSLAAQRLNATQPGLSKQLALVEDELGFPVFIRRGKRLEALSELGREVVERAKIICTQTANIHTLAADRRDDIRRVLRIATTPTQAGFVLPRSLSAIRAQFPEVSLQLQTFPEVGALDCIDRDEADIAILSSPTQPAIDHVSIPLFRWDLTVFARRSHPVAGLTRSLRLADFSDLSVMTYDSARASESAYAQTFKRAGMCAPPPAVTCRDPDVLKSLVRNGDGIGLMAEMVWTPEDVDLATLRVDHLFETKVTWAVLPKDRMVGRHTLAFIAHLAPHLDLQTVRAAAVNGEAATWPQPPFWRDLHRPAEIPTGRAAIRLVGGHLMTKKLEEKTC